MDNPGWKTTEFWLTLAAIVVSALVGSGLFQEGSTVLKVLMAIAAVLAALGYGIGRAWVKGKRLDNASPPGAKR